MTATARDELMELVRLFGVQTQWQRELGGLELPSRGELPPPLPASAAVAAAAETAATPAPVAPAPAAITPPSPAVIARPQTPAVVPPASTAARPAPPVAPVTAPVRAPALFADVAKPEAPKVGGPLVEGPERVRRLRTIQDEVAQCGACRLGRTRKNTVFARGNPFARLCFVGEGPGEQEDLQGLPFVGPAGQLLDRIIAGMGLSSEHVYIANVVKCRPPGNRQPELDEMQSCTPFLVRQLDLVRPELIVALGRTAASYLLATKEPMGRLRGHWKSWEGIPVMPTWHPSYVLRTPDPSRREVWEDMKLVLDRLGLPIPSRKG